MQDVEYRRLVEDSPLATFVVQDARVVWVNPAARRLLRADEVAAAATSVDPLDGVELASLVHADDRALLDEVLTAEDGSPVEPVPREWRLLRTTGDPVTVEVVAAPARFGGRSALTLAVWDITGHAARRSELAHRATHDRLTDLPNRALLEDRWLQARSRARRTGLPPMVVFCDVDDLKVINDRYGHVMGDAALVAVAARLRQVTRAEDTVARFGGDEFVLLVESTADIDAGTLASRLRPALGELEINSTGGNSPLRVRCSVGVVADDLERSTTDVLAQADRRMYQDKRR